MTWNDIKVACLQKLGLISGGTVVSNETTAPYLAAMPLAANEGLLRLCIPGRYRKKHFSLAQTSYHDHNLLGGRAFDAYTVGSESLSFTAEGVRAYYFEVFGAATVQLWTGSALTDTIAVPAAPAYAAHKGVIAESAEPITLKFCAQAPYTVRNVCLYDLAFADADAVPPFVPERVYPLHALLPDFCEADTANAAFIGTGDFSLSRDGVLTASGALTGEWRIPYFAYPELIQSSTPDQTEIDIEEDGLRLLPLYICSQLAKEDAPSLAAAWRNEFEIGLGAGRQARGGARIVVDSPTGCAV